MTTTAKTEKILDCDYLIVGAGAAPLPFIDTLLTELPDTKIILIDKKGAPGGHWVDAYGYVRLHQPSVVYGIASKQLEGNWLKCMITNFILPWNHRANKTEVLSYFSDFVKEKEQIDFYPNCVYNFDNKEDDSEDNIHSFSSVDGSVSYKVNVNVKLIDATKGENIIPHDSPLQFPVDDEVRVMTPNQVYDSYEGNSDEKSLMLKNKYVVLGAGKTGMDCIVYLQRTMKIDPANIAWVISNDVWMTKLEGGGNPKDWTRTLVENDNDINKAALEMEEKGKMVRIDKNVMPTVFKFPVIPSDDLKILQDVKTIIRRGRATAIRRKTGDNSKVMVEFGSDHSPWDAFAPIDKCVFVHATSPGPFGAKGTTNIFNSEKKMTLDTIFSPPVSISMSCLAKVEANRRKGTLDIEFMRRLMLAREGETSRDFKENEILDSIIQASMDAQSMLNLAVLFAILDKDPLVPMNWMKQNRLAFLGAIPGYKCLICDDIRLLQSKGETVGLVEKDTQMLELLSDKIQPLEGM